MPGNPSHRAPTTSSVSSSSGVGASSTFPTPQGAKDQPVRHYAAATAVKRELEGQEAPAAKRQKVLSKESLAAMAAIAATARLPTQVMKLCSLASHLQVTHMSVPFSAVMCLQLAKHSCAVRGSLVLCITWLLLACTSVEHVGPPYVLPTIFCASCKTACAMSKTLTQLHNTLLATTCSNPVPLTFVLLWQHEGPHATCMLSTTTTFKP